MCLFAGIKNLLPNFMCLGLLSMAMASACPAFAKAPCLVQHEQLLNALTASVKASGGPANGGFETHEWAAVVARDGTVCAIAFSGPTADSQWPGSRLIAAEKANTANGLSLRHMALSTGNLYAPTQPGGALYGLQLTNPVNLAVAYAGDPAAFGTPRDPLVGKPIGGVVVFGGGLALYDDKGIVGGLGASGDSSCADHNIAWRVRHALGLDKVPAGVNPRAKDAIVYDIDPSGKSASGWGHPKCPGNEADIAAEIGAGVGGSMRR
jgi:uncharacterized protein GlcG (DUF336 family)